MEIKNKHIIVIDLIILVGTLIAVISIIGYVRPLVIAPIDTFETINTNVLFEFEKAELILIDDNIEFSSPQKYYAENNLVINLKPGKYYWKLDGVINSEIRELTIISEVDLKLKESENMYQLVNAGNLELDVEVYDKGKLIKNIILIVDEEKQISGDKFIGGENG